jgi:hypothetical protein
MYLGEALLRLLLDFGLWQREREIRYEARMGWEVRKRELRFQKYGAALLSYRKAHWKRIQ